MPRAGPGARPPRRQRTRPSAQGAPPDRSTASTAHTSGYCRTEAANWAGTSARMVRAQRSSCRHSAPRVASGTVVAGTVSASAHRQAEALHQPARARCRRPGDPPGRGSRRSRSSVSRRSIMRGAEAVLPPHRPRQQRAGQEAVVDLHGAQGPHDPRRRYGPAVRHRAWSPRPPPAAASAAASRRSQSGATCTSESAITSTSCFAAGSMLIRLATLRFGPCPAGSTTTAMSQPGNRACSLRTTGSAVSARSCTPNTTCQAGYSWRQTARQRLLQQRFVAVQRLQDRHRHHRRCGIDRLPVVGASSEPPDHDPAADGLYNPDRRKRCRDTGGDQHVIRFLPSLPSERPGQIMHNRGLDTPSPAVAGEGRGRGCSKHQDPSLPSPAIAGEGPSSTPIHSPDRLAPRGVRPGRTTVSCVGVGTA